MPIYFTFERAPTGGGGASKTVDAPVLTSKGLTFLNVTDALTTESHDTNDPHRLFDPNTGGRNQQDQKSILGYDRWSIGTHFGKKCLKTEFRAGHTGYLRYGSLWLPTGYSELGFRASMYVPGDFELLNSSGGNIDGKSAFGIICGEPNCYNPNAQHGGGLENWQWRQGGFDQVHVPSAQHGASLGVNMKYWGSDNSFRLTTYIHVPGGKGSGGVWRERVNKWSIISSISGYPDNDGVTHKGTGEPLPRDRWFDVVVFAKMDTSLNSPNGEFEVWVEHTPGGMSKDCWAYDVDMGGTRGNRPGLGMVRRSDNKNDGSSGLSADPNGHAGSLWSSTGGGWRLRGIFARDMLGGAYDDAHKPRKTSAYYVTDWALFGNP